MYVDGFLLAFQRGRKSEYIKHARFAAEVLKDYGAARIVECWEDDVPEGKLNSMPMAVKRGEDEIVVFAWIEYPDKAARERCRTESMADPRFASSEVSQMPFNAARMIFGGFNPVMDF